jgi:hypothetical protein
MKAIKPKTIFLLFSLVPVFLNPVFVLAEDRRSIPLDLYLIIDSSEKFREIKDETTAWINEQIIDRLLQEGDRLVIWSAGDAATIIYAETIGASKDEAKNKIRNLEIQGRSPDFGSALQEATSRAAQGSASRISMTLLVSTAESLAPSLGGSSAGLFRWSRVEQYSRWQALVVAPSNLGEKVRRAAASYMNSR